MTPQPGMPFFSNQGGSAALACNGYVQTPHRRWPRPDATALELGRLGHARRKVSIRWSRSCSTAAKRLKSS